jgi:hypothetical protein
MVCKQNFFSTIFITGLESALTQDAQEILDQKEHNRQPLFEKRLDIRGKNW